MNHETKRCDLLREELNGLELRLRAPLDLDGVEPPDVDGDRLDFAASSGTDRRAAKARNLLPTSDWLSCSVAGSRESIAAYAEASVNRRSNMLRLQVISVYVMCHVIVRNALTGVQTRPLCGSFPESRSTS